MKFLALALCFALAGCGAKARDYIEVATFGDTSSMAVLTDGLKMFEKKTGIKCKPIFIPYNSFSQKVISQLSANTAPDVLWVEVGFYVTLQRAGALEELDPFIAKDKVDLGQYYKGVMDRFTRDKKTYALPNDTAPSGVLYYNKDMFKKAGLKFPNDKWTWNDLLAAAKKMKKTGKSGRVDVWGYQDQYAPDWMNWIYANGGAMVDDVKNPTKCLLAEPNALEAVQFLQDLIYKHEVYERSGNREQIGGYGSDLFVAGRLAMFRSGFWVVPQLRKDAKGIDWDIAPFPKGPKAKGFRWGTGGSGWSMTKNARNPEKAWKVIQYLAGEDYQKLLLKEGGTQPGLAKLAASPAFLQPDKKPANTKMMLWMPDYAVYAPEIKEYEEILNAVVNPRMDTLLTAGNAAPGPVLKEIAAEFDKRLAAAGK